MKLGLVNFTKLVEKIHLINNISHNSHDYLHIFTKPTYSLKAVDCISYKAIQITAYGSAQLC